MPPLNTDVPPSLFVSLTRAGGGGRMRAQHEEVCCKVYAISDGGEERWNWRRGTVLWAVSFYFPRKKSPPHLVTLFRKSWAE